jgi:hypothetical protein
MKKLGWLSWFGIILVGIFVGLWVAGIGSFPPVLVWLVVLYFFIRSDLSKYNRNTNSTFKSLKDE